MEKISINLLPTEFIQEEVKKGKFYKIQAISVSVILLMFFLSMITISLRILQSNQLKVASAQVNGIEEKVTGLKGKQAQLLLLKSRLETIQGHIGTQSKVTQMYEITSDLLPASLVVSALAFGRDGSAVLTAISPDIASVDLLIDDLTDKEKNEEVIGKVFIEALSRGKDGIYRISLKVESK